MVKSYAATLLVAPLHPPKAIVPSSGINYDTVLCLDRLILDCNLS